MEISRLNTPEILLNLMQDRNVTDICINGPGLVFFERGNHLEKVNSNSIFLNEKDLRHWTLSLIRISGLSFDAKHPFIDGVHRSHRFHIAFPPISRSNPQVSLRRLNRVNSHEQSIDPWKSDHLFPLLSAKFKAGMTVIVAGPTGSGKTTLLQSLIGTLDATERIIGIEDTQELCPAHQHYVSLTARRSNSDGYGGVSLDSLLRESLRMRPDRIIIGEIRGKEITALLQAINTGHSGSAATLHANGPRDSLRRLELLALLESPDLNKSILADLISTSVDLLVQVSRGEEGRRISSIYQIAGKEGDTILLRQMLN